MSGFFKRLVGKKTEEAYSGLASDHLGWIWTDQTSTFLNVTPRFEDFIGQFSDHSFQLPPDADKYTYMLVPGLFTNKYPGYMNSPEEQMRKMGLSVVRIKIDTGGSVEKNANLIKYEVEHAPEGRKVVLIGHSKGAVDAAAALSLYPNLFTYVRCFISIQAPFGGTPIPQDVMSASGFLNAVVETLKIFDPDAMKDITYARRREFLQLHPYPSDQIPTLCFGSFTTNAGAMCSSTQKHIQDKYGALSDGLVPLRDAFTPGSAIVVIEGLDHGAPVFTFGEHRIYTSSNIFLALIATALEMPPNVSRLCRHPPSPVINGSTDDNPRQGEVFLYEHKEYGGDCLKLNASCENLADYCMNNKISSIKVGPNTILEVFDNVYFGGLAMRVDYSTPLVMKSLNDMISSVRITVPGVTPPAPTVAAFDWSKANATLDIAHSLATPGPVPQEIWGFPHPHYNGPPLGYRGEIAYIPELIASIRLGSSVAVTAYPTPNFTGTPYTITGDHPTLPLRITSMKVHPHHSLNGTAAAVLTTQSPNVPQAAAQPPLGADHVTSPQQQAPYPSPPYQQSPPPNYTPQPPYGQPYPSPYAGAQPPAQP